jgi:hypothetical protein
MVSLILALWFVALGPAAAAPADAACLRYEPDTVRITGSLARHVFYGQPGFGEDAKHDANEVGLYLELAAPVCTLATADNESKSGVRQVQLVLDSAGYSRLRPAIGKTITLRGTVFAAITGHHHSPILLQVLKPVRLER